MQRSSSCWTRMAFHDPTLSFFFCKKYRIYYKSLLEVQYTSNIIKITSGSLEHQTTIAATRTSRRRTAVVAPMPEPAWPYRWQTRSLHARVPKDQRPGAVFVVIESLNWSEEPDTKYRRCVRTTRNPNLTTTRSWHESTPEIRLIRLNERTRGGSELGRLTRRRTATICPKTPPLRGLKPYLSTSRIRGTRNPLRVTGRQRLACEDQEEEGFP